MNKINTVLKDVREKRNYTHAYMAERLGISKPYYWQIENGKRNLYYKLAVEIADILKTKPDVLFYDYYKNK